MLCPRCRTPVRHANGSGSRLESEASQLNTGPAPAGDLCAACGALLPPPGTTARLLAKFAQLARFGLADRSVTLLRGGNAGPEVTEGRDR